MEKLSKFCGSFNTGLIFIVITTCILRNIFIYNIISFASVDCGEFLTLADSADLISNTTDI